MSSKCSKYCFLILSFLYGAFETIPAMAQGDAPQRITVAIDNLSRTRISNSKHPLAQPAFDQGPVDPGLKMERMVLVLGATEEQEHQLRTFLDSQQTKGAQLYHKWMTPEEFGRKFGPSPADVQTVAAWLQQQGFTVGSMARSGRWIEFSGSSSQVEQAFKTQMRRYSWQGVEHIGNAMDISIPKALAPAVRGVLSLHDSFSKPYLAKAYQVHRNANGVLEPVSPDFTLTTNNGTRHFLTPADYAKIYNLSPLLQHDLAGRGQTIALVARSNIELTDVEAFRQIFNLPVNDPVIILNGPDPGIANADDITEATLDAEWAGAIAPKATVDLVATASTATTDGVALSALHIVDNNLAAVMSVSFGQCESSLGSAGTALFSALWQQAAAQGISVFVSSGDTGAAGCDAQVSLQPASGVAVNGLASTPFNTAVGGSEFNENGNDATFWSSTNGTGFGSAIGYIPEVAWNDSCTPTDANTVCQTNGIFLRNATGGGASTVFPKPSWQPLSLTPNDNARDVPDVALAASGAHDGYLLCLFGSCQTDATGTILNNASVVGGTSASSPSFAGIVAIVNQQLAERQGLANYVLYPLATRENFSNCNSTNATNPLVTSPCVFNDVTLGTNNVAGTSGAIGFSAGTGYDLATGLGSVNAANLVNAWSSVVFQGSQTALSTPGKAVSGAHGLAVPFTVNVQALAGTSVPTGTASLITDTGIGIGEGTLSSGAFSGSFSNLPGGHYNLIARYPGDGNFAASDSSPIPVNITPEGSTISLGQTTPAVVAYGDPSVFHAHVTGNSGNGFPTGTVSFTDGGSPLISLPLDSAGQADLISFGFPGFGDPLTLTVGMHTISASYSGDSSFQASGPSAVVTVTVTKATPPVLLGAGQTTVTTTQPLTLHVFVKNTGPILPTGTLQFTDNGSNIGSPVPISTVSSAQVPQADFQVTLTTLGTHTLTAQYSGDSVYLAAVSSPQAVTVTTGAGAATQTSVTPSVTSTTVAQQVNYTVNVTPSTPSTQPLTGTVSVISGELGTVGQAALQNGQAVIPVTAIFAGPMTVVAQYSGDVNFAPSGSSPVTVTVARGTPTVTLTASAPSVQANQQVSLVATITAQAVANSSAFIQFFDSLNGGPAQPLGAPQTTTIGKGFNFTFALPAFLPVGSNVVTAQFAGNISLNGATSNPVTVTVTPALPFQFSANVDNLSIAAGQSGTVILTVNPNGAFNSATTLSCGSGLPVGATCSFAPSSITPDGFPVNSVLTISTLAPRSSVAGRFGNAWWGISFGAGFAALLLAGSSRRRLRGKSIALLASVCVFSSLLGCGGGGGGGQTGGPSNTSISLSSPTTKVATGNPFALTASVTAASGSTPTGTVTFFDGGAQVGQPVTLVNGQAQLNVAAGNSLGVGTHSFTATYNGSAQDQGSTSSSLIQVITGTVQVQIAATGGGQSQQTAVNVTLQ